MGQSDALDGRGNQIIATPSPLIGLRHHSNHLKSCMLDEMLQARNSELRRAQEDDFHIFIGIANLIKPEFFRRRRTPRASS